MLKSIDELVARETKREEEASAAANRPMDASRLEILLLAKKLVQKHRGDESTEGDSAKEAAALLEQEENPVCPKLASSWRRRATLRLMRSLMFKPWWCIAVTNPKQGFE